MFIIMEVTKTYMSNCKALMHVAKINSERLLVHKVIQLHRFSRSGLDYTHPSTYLKQLVTVLYPV